MINKEVYQPDDDTFLLLSAAEQECRASDKVLEVGCGSGYISSALIGGPSTNCGEILATDINPHAAREARSRGLNVIRADLLSAIRGPFDLVIFNPPYLPTFPEDRIDDWLELALDGGPDGRRVISRFINKVGRILAPEGRFLLLLSSLTGLPEVESLLDKSGFRHEVVLRKRVEGEDLIVIRAKRKECIKERI
jgi:release factor glutamine methyltransferase